MTIIVTTTSAVSSTVQLIVNRALRLIHQLAAGSSPTPGESADALTALNAMLDSWQNEKLICYALREESLSLVASQGSYTLGPSGDLDTTRPISIHGAYVISGGVSYPVKPIDTGRYAGISNKTAEGAFPDKAYYQPSMPTGTLYVHPVPNTSGTLQLVTRTPLTAFASTSETVSLPPGWEEAITSNLAIRLAPEYETQASGEVREMARESKASIKRANSRPITASTELTGLFGGGSFNILSGDS